MPKSQQSEKYQQNCNAVLIIGPCNYYLWQSPLVKAHRVVSMQTQNKINKQSWTLVNATPWTELVIPCPIFHSSHFFLISWNDIIIRDQVISLNDALVAPLRSCISKISEFIQTHYLIPSSSNYYETFFFLASKQKHTYLSCPQGFEL